MSSPPAVRVSRYRAEDSSAWNAHVAAAKNGSFLFDRRYMEYHSDRFEDHSLLFHQGNELVAVLPANAREDRLASHGGLTYGGLVLRADARLHAVLACFEAFVAHARKAGFREIVYKQLPAYLWRAPCGEDEFALYRLGAELLKRETSFVIRRSTTRLPYQERRLRSIRKGEKAGVRVTESRDFARFWDRVLSPNLRARHSVDPVHSAAEITLLAERFPEAIRLHEAWLGDELVAGAVAYVNPAAAHTQYISSTEAGRDSGALDLLFRELIERVYAGHEHFSFGTANRADGNELNDGLVDWKEGFGARAVSHNVYCIAVSAEASK